MEPPCGVTVEQQSYRAVAKAAHPVEKDHAGRKLGDEGLGGLGQAGRSHVERSIAERSQRPEEVKVLALRNVGREPLLIGFSFLGRVSRDPGLVADLLDCRPHAWHRQQEEDNWTDSERLSSPPQ